MEYIVNMIKGNPLMVYLLVLVYVLLTTKFYKDITKMDFKKNKSKELG